MWFRKLLVLLWPPLGTYRANKELNKYDPALYFKDPSAEGKKAWDSFVGNVREKMDSIEISALADVEKLVNTLRDSELKRKEMLENKAVVLVSSVTIVVTIIFGLQALSLSQSSTSSASNWLFRVNLPIRILLMSASLYFLVSAYYGLKVRVTGAFAQGTADDVVTRIKDGRIDLKEEIVKTLGQIKWNEKSIIRKSNNLMVAEELFFRGLALLAVMVLLISLGPFI